MSYFELLRSRAHSALPYISTLFYAEIILLFIFLNFLYGKPVALTAGLVLTVLLTLHVIILFNDNPSSRKIQLLLMDIHFAWSVAFVVIRMVPGIPLSGFDVAVVLFRTLAASVELPIILLVTTDSSELPG
ncbi:MAG TPA: hypothetical protein PK514_03230 [Spirochaetota bacterium]|nr:hypothetical protein [Spirochaetota bacterium]